MYVRMVPNLKIYLLITFVIDKTFKQKQSKTKQNRAKKMLVKEN